MPAQGAPAWNVAYEVDFTALPTQLLMADTTHVISDRTWTKFDSVDAQTFQITAGTGLQMRAAAGQTSIIQQPPTTQVPHIAIQLGSLITDYDPHLDYVFQMYVTANNADLGTTVVNNATVGVLFTLYGLNTIPQGMSNRTLYIAQISRTAGAGPFDWRALYTGTGTPIGGSTFPITTYNVISIQNAAHGVGQFTAALGIRSGADWPAQNTLRVFASGCDNGTNDELIDPVDNWLGIGFGCGLGNTTGTFQATVAGLRVLVKPNPRRIAFAA